MRNPPAAMVPEVPSVEPVTLAVADSVLEVLPEVGLVCSSFTIAGREFLRFHSVAAVLDGHTSGIPLLAPWANRLRGPEFEVDGAVVRVLGAPGVHVDESGLPIHGTMVGRSGWEIDSPVVTEDSASLLARFDAAACAEVMASFPFPHSLSVEYLLEPSRLSITTTLSATASLPVPVSFGWHPYFALPDTRRDGWTLELPDRFQLELDQQQLPTGEERFEPAATISLAGRAFDDGYRLGAGGEFALSDGNDRIVVGFDDTYTHAQVYAPIASNLVALEPMTAATDALSRGETRFVAPGEQFRATFTISIL